MNEHLIEVGILALSTLLSPVVPMVVKYLVSRSRRRRGRRRRQTDGLESHEAQSSETGWVQLPFVLLLAFLLSFSLDIYVVLRQSRQGLSSNANLLINDLAVLVAACQIVAIGFLAIGPVIRREYHALMTAMVKGNAEQAAIQGALSARLDEMVTMVARLSDEHTTRQRELDTHDKELVAALTQVRDEQSAAFGELLRQIRAVNKTPKALLPQSQEPLPQRKPDLKRRHGASR